MAVPSSGLCNSEVASILVEIPSWRKLSTVWRHKGRLSGWGRPKGHSGDAAPLLLEEPVQRLPLSFGAESSYLVIRSGLLFPSQLWFGLNVNARPGFSVWSARSAGLTAHLQPWGGRQGPCPLTGGTSQESVSGIFINRAKLQTI